MHLEKIRLLNHRHKNKWLWYFVLFCFSRKFQRFRGIPRSQGQRPPTSLLDCKFYEVKDPVLLVFGSQMPGIMPGTCHINCSWWRGWNNGWNENAVWMKPCPPAEGEDWIEVCGWLLTGGWMCCTLLRMSTIFSSVNVIKRIASKPTTYFGGGKEFFFLFFSLLGFELRALHLLGRHSTMWAMPLAQKRSC
jgi:hypothetical protein